MCTLDLLLLIPLALKWPMQGGKAGAAPHFESEGAHRAGPTDSLAVQGEGSRRTSPCPLLGKASHNAQTSVTDFRQRNTAPASSSQRKLQPAAWFLARPVHMDKTGSPPVLRNSTFMPSCSSWTDTSAQCTSEGGSGPFKLRKKQKGYKGKNKWGQNIISGLLLRCRAEKSGTHSVNTCKPLRQGNIYC